MDAKEAETGEFFKAQRRNVIGSGSEAVKAGKKNMEKPKPLREASDKFGQAHHPA